MATLIDFPKNSQLTPHIQFDYVELLGRSNFSFLQGASHPEEMVKRAQELQYKGIAICDVNGLYGVVRGHVAAFQTSAFSNNEQTTRSDFVYHLGSEIVLEDFSAVLMPLNKEGYSQLCQLITKGKQNAPKTYLSLRFSDLLSYHDSLLIFPLPPWSLEKLEQLRAVYKDRLYLPVSRTMNWNDEHNYHQALELEKEGYQLFATQRPLMHSPDRKPLFDVLTCILHGSKLDAAKTKLLQNRQRHLHDLTSLFSKWCDRPDLLAQTVKISNRIKFSLTELRYVYPSDYLPPNMNAPEYLRHKVEEGLHWRYPNGCPLPVRRQIEKEILLIRELEFEDYFLTLDEICHFARSREILFQGRGSAANSVVCFVLGLTSLDPMKFNLMFERFLSKERGEPPDIDIDFEHNRREEVLQYVYQRYGVERAAMVSTVICYRSRMAIREVSKVMGVPEEQIDSLIKYMGREGINRLQNDLEARERFKLSMHQLDLVLHLSLELQGFPRHIGIHTGGFVLSQFPLSHIVPIEKATMVDRYVVQWNKDDIDRLKMMKLDLLGLGMLHVLEKCLSSLRSHYGIRWNLSQIPADDTETYQMIQKAETIGVFQIESRAQMSLLPRLKPAQFYDLVVEVAIVRPGPIQGGMVHPYLKRRERRDDPIYYPHPALEPILKRTLGVPIFQEQIMQIVSTVGGFTPGEADELRRIMSSSWKRQAVMENIRRKLLGGMQQSGVSLGYAEQIFQTILGFSSYGFPESHAASFALLTYASCYFKCHYPAVFTCALLNSQPMGFYDPRALVQEAERVGVHFLEYDVKSSQKDYTLEWYENDWAIRRGYVGVHGLKKTEIDKICEHNGEFESFEDFVRKTKLRKETLTRLALVGAFSGFGYSHQEILWQVQSLDLDEQSLFFAQSSEEASPTFHHESPWDKLQREYELTGFALGSHPMTLMRDALIQVNKRLKKQKKSAFVTSDELKILKHQTKVKVAGLKSLFQKPPTAKGVAFITLEDERGHINLILHAPIYEKFRMVVNDSTFIWAEGPLQSIDGVRNVMVKQMGALPVSKLLEAGE